MGGYVLTNKVPDWMGAESLLQFQKAALPGETPYDAFKRVADGDDELFEHLWKGYLGLATPVLANYKTERGLPISCFSSVAEDSLDGIFSTGHEIARLTKAGGGTAVDVSDIRGRGAPIRGYGTSNGVIAWCKLYDVITDKVRQGNVRRGALAAYLDANHSDIEEFLRIRRPEGDPRNQCLDLHHGVKFDNVFMERVINGDKEARAIWGEALKTRLETGEPYMFFTDNANADVNFPAKPDYRVRASNLCNEIYLHSDVDHTFVCCLSSLNLAKYDEWKNTRVVERAVRLLDDVMEEFIQKASSLPGLERAVRFAVKSRALGLGAMGFHTLLQSRGLPYGSKEAFKLNNQLFKTIKERAYEESTVLGEERGVPEWVAGLGRRNSHLLAIAPTYSNSIVSGFVSEGVNLIPANAYLHRSSQGSFIVRNKHLESLNLLTEKDWQSVVAARGSVQHLNIDPHLKEVFLTAREINQLDHINMAGVRQQYIDQGQSLNIFCNYDVPKGVFNNWHITAWKLGLKGLYYVRASAATKGDVVNYSSDCVACEA